MNLDDDFESLIRGSKIDDDIFAALEAGLKGQDVDTNLGIVEFKDKILTGFNMSLFLSQKVILKAMYCEPLDDTVVDEKFGLTEQGLMDKWVAEGKTNWQPPEKLLAEFNDRLPEMNSMLRPHEQIAPKDVWAFQEIIIEAGMRSSKTTMAAICVAYEFYKLMRTDKPQNLFGLPTSSFIFMTVMATTAGQGENTVYGAVKNLLTGSRYFQEIMTENQRLKVGESEIKFPEKNMVIGLGHSKATSIVGRSAQVVVFDEIAMFSTDDGHTSNAADVYGRIGRSTATFGDKAKRIAISSVKQQGDFMEVLVRDSWKNVGRGTLVFSLTTFDVNPMMNMQNPIISSDYERDIETAQRDYENLRPGTTSGFFNPQVIDQCISHEDTKYCNFQTEHQVDEIDGQERTYINLELSNIIRPERANVMYAHADPGVRKDSFGLVIGHPEFTDLGVCTVIDIVLEWIPKKAGKGVIYEVNLDNVEDNIIELNKLMRFTHLTFDQWESHGAIQRLFRAGIPTFKQQFTKGNQIQMYKALRQRMKDGLVKIPNHPTLLEELKNLELQNGTKVNHPKNKDSSVPGRGKISKDLADGVAMVNWIISCREVAYDRNSKFISAPDQTGNFIKTIGQTRASQIGRDFR